MLHQVPKNADREGGQRGAFIPVRAPSRLLHFAEAAHNPRQPAAPESQVVFGPGGRDCSVRSDRMREGATIAEGFGRTNSSGSRAVSSSLDGSCQIS
jgi:hypothetical protein